jgi:hypothetical protein
MIQTMTTAEFVVLCIVIPMVVVFGLPVLANVLKKVLG